METPKIIWIDSGDPPETFPNIERVDDNSDGLLAAGGDLSSQRLIYAYQHGIFPWYDDSQPILWWSPDPRCVLYPRDFHVSRRLRRSLSRSCFEVSFNRAFGEVITTCAESRDGQRGTWITADMLHAYTELHEQGWAHSIEVWDSGQLVGGLYGLAIGRVFFGESMFSRQTNGSKAAMLALTQQLTDGGFELLDCQVESQHLASLGAVSIPRREFAATLKAACHKALPFSGWPAGQRPIGEYLT